MKDKLLKIQSELKAPKNQYNSFGKYKYRNCEDILEALKPLLKENKCVLSISDEIINIGKYNYIKSMVILQDCESDSNFICNGIAREAETQKGMNDSQITGSTSSYARKYALNGLFAIDDTKDSDHTNKHGKEEKAPDKPSNNSMERITPKQAEEWCNLCIDSKVPPSKVQEFLKELKAVKSTDILRCDYEKATKMVTDFCPLVNEI